MNIEGAYARRYENYLQPLSVAIDSHLRECLGGLKRIDRISVRPKSIERFVAKSKKLERGKLKYVNPLEQIQDQIGARIVTFYLSDVDIVSQEVEKYFRPVEAKSLVPESESSFGYFGKHYILIMPSDVFDDKLIESQCPQFFELQIKTLFQHAWSEAEHDLGYKPGESPLTSDEQRSMAFTAAQAWGADRLFDEIFHRRTIAAKKNRS